MGNIIVDDSRLREAATQGMDEFLQVFVDAIYEAIGGQLTAESMESLNTDQITLLAYHALREEVMDGGFVQLIHNGYGGFIFLNPFARMMKEWGLADLCKLVRKVHPLYRKHHELIEADCTDEAFMALFEQLSCFDDFDDEFVENEEQWTEEVAHYVDNHIERFATIQP
ncbi:MAG: DMP19 family protein [Prevotella sp.]